VLDFGLDHIPALASVPGESYAAQLARVFAADSMLLDPNYQALAPYDLTPDTMKAFNLGGPRAYPNTKYFSASTGLTSFCDATKSTQCPIATASGHSEMEFFLQPTSNVMGNLTGVVGARDLTINFTLADEENDGLVSRQTSRGPHNGAGKDPQAVPLKWQCNFLCVSGQWVSSWTSPSYTLGNWFYKDYAYDHLQIVGFYTNSIFTTTVRPWTNVYPDVIGFINSVKTCRAGGEGVWECA
jgi:hypothetical protein